MKGKIAVSAAAVVALAAAALVKPWEGYSPTPYLDIVGVRTVCYGQTGNIENRRYSKAECEAMLQSELGQYLSELQRCIHQPLRQHEWAAVLSLAYNMGTPAICRSTMVRKINAGAPPREFCAELRKWVYAGGKRVKGLVNRREAEYRVCMGYEP